MKLLLPTLLSLFAFNAFGQTKVTSIAEINLLATKKLDQSLLVLSTDGKYIYQTSLDLRGNIIWENEIKTTSLSGYNFNKIHIFQCGDTVVLAELLPKETNVHLFSELTGSKILDYTIKESLSSLNFSLVDGMIRNLTAENGKIFSSTVTKNGLSEKVLIKEVDNINYKPKLQVHFINGHHAYSTSRVLESNHGKMHLYLNRLDLVSKDTLERELDLELRGSSFTYNSTLDQNVYGVVPSEGGFYILGKLDLPFKRKYPTQKLGEAFLGFWIAKFSKNLDLIYFKEYPFAMFPGLVPNNVIRKATIIELEEFKDGSTLVAMNNLRAAMYGSKYFMYLNNKGEYGLANSARDEYHFFEKDKQGLRPAGRKLNTRLEYGDWPTYPSNAYLYFSPKPNFFSNDLNTLINLKDNAKKDPSKKAYSVFNFETSTLYLEYLDKKGGTLNVYR